MSKFATIAPRIWAGVATTEELAEAGVENVIAIKSDCEHIRLRGSPSRKSANKELRTVQHIASDETPDRMGDIIRVKGWKLDNFLSNPVLLRNHDNQSLPLGLVEDIRRSRVDGRPVLISESKFFEDEKQDDAGRLYARLVLDGDMPAVSVGFMPLKTHRPGDEKERAELGLGDYGVVYETAELLELSVVTVPANPSALMRSLDAMVERGEVAKTLAAQVAKTFDPSKRVVVPVAKIESAPETPPADGPAPDVAEHVGPIEQRVLTVADTAERIEKALAELKTTLSDELSALRAQLEVVSRGVSSQPVQGAAQGDTQTPAPDARAIDSKAFFSTAFAPLLSRQKGAHKQ